MQAKTISMRSIDVVKMIIKAEGVRGLWRGLAPTIFMQVPATGL
jgi:hypothetical protein